MIEFDASEHPHRRFNPLTQDWVLCSPHRTKRPWQGQTEPPQVSTLPQYDEKCFLCPGNTRAGGLKTETYTSTWVFENDYAAVTEEPVIDPSTENPLKAALYKTETVRGKCFVICFNPRHDLTIAELDDHEIVPIIQAWTQVYNDVSKNVDYVKFIQIFENKGAMMGCSNPHPHGQVWTLSAIPSIPSKILKAQRNFAAAPSLTSNPDIPLTVDGKPSLLLSYAYSELHPQPSPRVIFQTKHFVACVPYWATWPFEVMILPFKRHIASLPYLTEGEQHDLSNALRRVTCRLDNLFKCSFAYSMGINQAPKVGSGEEATAQLQISLYPPLLRSATVRKFLVGFELFAEAQRDLTPEQGAQRIRDCSEVHYKRDT